MLRLPRLRAVTVLLALAGSPLAKASDDLAPGKQAALLLRILPYDRNLRARSTEAITIAIVYRDGKAESEAYGLDMAAALRDLSHGLQLHELPIRVVSVPYAGPEDLEAAVVHQRVNALYLCTDLGGALDPISDTARRHKILTFSGREGEVRDRLSIGLLRRGARPSLLVNLREATAEGADLEPEFLALSEVLR